MTVVITIINVVITIVVVITTIVSPVVTRVITGSYCRCCRHLEPRAAFKAVQFLTLCLKLAADELGPVGIPLSTFHLEPGEAAGRRLGGLEPTVREGRLCPCCWIGCATCRQSAVFLAARELLVLFLLHRSGKKLVKKRLQPASGFLLQCRT